MLKSKKGFTMVELLAMIVITTAIIFPLLNSLIDSIKVNDVMHNRKSAITISETTIYAFGKLSFNDLSNNISPTTYFVELNKDNCVSILADPKDDEICVKIFDTMWNNLTFDASTFRVFIYDYSLTPGQIGSLSTNPNIPVAVHCIRNISIEVVGIYRL